MRCITVGHWLRDWQLFRSVALALPSFTFEVVAPQAVDLEGLPNVRHHRNIKDVRLADLYRSSDILFLPLTESTANNALLEGIASGLPVVATNLEAVRAYIAGPEGLLVGGNRTEDFVEALKRLHGDDSLRAGMGLSARVRAEALSWSRLVGQYEALYDAALSRPSISQEKVRGEG
jgi:glycosyltransferase involved in cell wall biosynthesis